VVWRAAAAGGPASGSVPHSCSTPGLLVWGENGERCRGPCAPEWQRALALADGTGGALLAPVASKRNPKGLDQELVSCYSAGGQPRQKPILRAGSAGSKTPRPLVE